MKVSICHKAEVSFAFGIFPVADLRSVSLEHDTVQGSALGTIMVLKGGKHTTGLNLMETREDPGLAITKERTDQLEEKHQIWSLLLILLSQFETFESLKSFSGDTVL